MLNTTVIGLASVPTDRQQLRNRFAKLPLGRSVSVAPGGGGGWGGTGRGVHPDAASNCLLKLRPIASTWRQPDRTSSEAARSSVGNGPNCDWGSNPAVNEAPLVASGSGTMKA